MGERITQRSVDIDTTKVAGFFENRAERFDQRHPLVAVTYQDSNPLLGESRDVHEKQVALPLLPLGPSTRVLDIGCGIGRWADSLVGKVASYHGTDLTPGLTEIASQRLAGQPGFTFQTLKAQEVAPDTLSVPPPFDLVIIAGVLAYINDAECVTVLANAAECCGPMATFYLREPVAVLQRLTLLDVWSEELSHNYSAIYRTCEELLDLFAGALYPRGFTVDLHCPLLPEPLSNRKETTQHMFILRKKP